MGFVDGNLVCEFYTFIIPGAVTKNATIGPITDVIFRVSRGSLGSSVNKYGGFSKYTVLSICIICKCIYGFISTVKARY
jgi:hypothetical protein